MGPASRRGEFSSTGSEAGPASGRGSCSPTDSVLSVPSDCPGYQCKYPLRVRESMVGEKEKKKAYRLVGFDNPQVPPRRLECLESSQARV